jgi:DNA recombination protein RmuC
MQSISVLSPLLIVVALAALALGFLLHFLLSHNKNNQLQQKIVELEQDLAVSTQKIEQAEKVSSDYQQQTQQMEQRWLEQQSNSQQLSVQLAQQKVRSEESLKANHEKLELLQKAKAEMLVQFRDLANQVMQKNSENFSEHHQKSLGSVLDPFKQQLSEFRKRVDHVYETESKERVSLLNEISSLKELNQQITEEASNLTQALKGDRKAQGNWGEVILERVLEASGLQKGREYETQMNLQSNDGNRFLPDVVIHLPDQKDIIVDSKVSLSAYERYFSSDSDDDRKVALKQHIQAIRDHVNKLSEKKYDDLKGLHTLDFVFVFIPVEPAYLLAVQEDANLFSDAFTKKIIVVSPTTLLATLRIVENLWRFERQNKNAEEIARQAGKLYDKFYGFITDLDKVGMRISQAKSSFDDAKSKLSIGRGNLLTSTEKLKTLGAKTRKQLDDKLLKEAIIDDSERSQGSKTDEA